MRRKNGVFVAVAGTGQESDTIQATVSGFFAWANIKLIETILYAHDDDDEGGVETDDQQMSQALGIGVEIVQERAG